ncbi:class I SAM-dependent methyltransferase [Micromonospora chokoriensis]
MSEPSDQASRWDAWADDDDALFGVPDPHHAATFLSDLAGSGPVLDLGAGTGRVATAIASHGIPVTALDISPAMVRRLKEVAGELPIDTVIGDMAEPPVDGPYSLVYTTHSTIFSLLTQTRQVACFASAARVLTPNGCFVIDAFIPSGRTTPSGLAVRALSAAHVDLSITVHDPLHQRMTFQEVRLSNGNLRLLPIEIRYAAPSELDLMAGMAGMALVARYANWDRAELARGSQRHVSVYKLSGLSLKNRGTR